MAVSTPLKPPHNVIYNSQASSSSSSTGAVVALTPGELLVLEYVMAGVIWAAMEVAGLLITGALVDSAAGVSTSGAVMELDSAVATGAGLSTTRAALERAGDELSTASGVALKVATGDA